LDIFKLIGKLFIDDEEAHGKMDKAIQKASSVGEKFGKMASVVGKATVAAVGAAATAVGAITKNAIESYADYEQLVGGVETLFGAGGKSLAEYAESVGKTVDECSGEYAYLMHAQDAVIEHAQGAYKTAGMSANEYMETVTSFSASLIASLGGDTVAAAEYADLAITDMSDNANKMGTSMESIQNAYQGFAKQNYTMLDNLKLGYGGTQQEMLRLVNDAAKVDSSIAKNNLSFANIVKAINVVQTELGITGTTAQEASTTISGSVSSMKSAWSNLVTGIADENANMEELIGNFIETLVGDGSGEGGVINNILPRIEQSLEGVGQVVEKMIPIIVAKVPTIVNEWLPKILQSGISMVKTLMDGMLQNSGSITTGAVSTILTFVNGILDNLPSILVSGAILIGEFAVGLVQALPEVLAKIPEIIVEIYNAFAANSHVFLEIGKSIVVGIWNGICALWNSLVENMSWLTSGLVAGFSYMGSGGTSVNINGSHADGLAYVPFDGYVAQLHEGERVLTKKEAREYNGSDADDKPIKIIVQSVLDGRVIGETAYNYSRRKARAGGI
jgi:hypothetical protein